MVSAPLGLAVDGAGTVYFADSMNNRIRRLVPAAATVTPPANLTAPSLAVVNAASLAQGAVAPGELVTIYGSGIGPTAGVAGAFDSTGLLASLLGGTAVRFDGVPAPLFCTHKPGGTPRRFRTRWQGRVRPMSTCFT